MKKFLVVLALVLAIPLAFAAVVGWNLFSLYRANYAKQDDSRVSLPAQHPHVPQDPNPLKNVYWGELHIHTAESFETALFGTTAPIEDAYRFARGEKLRSPGGELMQLARHSTSWRSPTTPKAPA